MKQACPRDGSYLRFEGKCGVKDDPVTPRSRTVDAGESREEEVESESSVHCSSLEERSNQMSSDLLGLSLRRIDRLHSMMSSMQARSLFVAFATSFSRRCT